MANEKNLIPQAHKLSVEEASRGGKASGEARRQRKTFREAVQQALETPLPDEWKEAIENDNFGVLLKTMDSNIQTALIASMLGEALKNGNTKAFEFLVALVGEKPVEEKKVEVKADENYKKIAASLVNTSVSDDDTL